MRACMNVCTMPPCPSSVRPLLLAGVRGCARGFGLTNLRTMSGAGDSGNGTLRWAVTQSNSRPGPDRVVFNLPPGETTIYLQSVRLAAVVCMGPVVQVLSACLARYARVYLGLAVCQASFCRCWA